MANTENLSNGMHPPAGTPGNNTAIPTYAAGSLPASTPPAKPKKKSQKCPQCPPAKKAFKNEGALANHLSSDYHTRKGDLSHTKKAVPPAKPPVKAAKKAVKCPKCPPERDVFKNNDALTSHLSSGYHDCHTSVSKPSKVEPPKNTPPKPRKKKEKCPKCPPEKKAFKNKDALANHLSSGYHERHGDQSKPEQAGPKTPNTTPTATPSQSCKCPQCPPGKKPFQNKAALASHLSSRYHKRKGNLNPGPQVPQADPIATTPEPLTPNEELIKHLASTLANSPRATFPSSLLSSFTTDRPVTQMLVLSPTSEIAEYTHDRLTARVEPFDITTYVCASGLDLIEGRRGFLGAAHIVSGTVTWVGYAVRKGYVDVSGVRLLVLNKEEALLMGDMAEGVAELVGLLEGVEVVRASVKMLGEDVEV